MASKQFIDEFVVGHNECRKMHGVPAINHNPELTSMATKWANILASRNRIESNENNKYKNEIVGEIVVKLPNNKIELNGLEVSKSWYNQIKDYKFDQPEINEKTKCFTQLIWKNTKEVGLGVGISPNGSYYIVAFYYPAGNIRNKNAIQQNVSNISF